LPRRPPLTARPRTAFRNNISQTGSSRYRRLISRIVCHFFVVVILVVRFLRVTVRFLVCAKEAEAQTAIIKKTAKIDFFILFDCFVFYTLHLKRDNVQESIKR